MGFIATDLATVPALPHYSWYLFLLEDRWHDPLREQLEKNFMKLAEDVGPNALVVRGAHPEQFYSQVFYEYALQDRMKKQERILPALLVTDTPPGEIRKDEELAKKAKIMLFPLSKLTDRAVELTTFLQMLCETLRSSEAIEALNATRQDGGWPTMGMGFPLPRSEAKLLRLWRRH
jgi:hypothetical protein